jgi:hypothetical protein
VGRESQESERRKSDDRNYDVQRDDAGSYANLRNKVQPYWARVCFKVRGGAECSLKLRAMTGLGEYLAMSTETDVQEKYQC